MKYRKILIIFIILIISLINIFILKKSQKFQTFDDILFLKIFSNSSEKINNENKYNFTIDYRNIDFKQINLNKTIERKTLINEKIAPGTSGSFDIILNSNQKLKYKIQFKSIDKKPYNLKFVAYKNNKILAKENTLEKISDKLEGIIDKNQEVIITIKWEWSFESEFNQEVINNQDTKDAQDIRKYRFNIITLGEKII